MHFRFSTALYLRRERGMKIWASSGVSIQCVQDIFDSSVKGQSELGHSFLFGDCHYS